MYVLDNGIEMYETLDDLVKKGITYVWISNGLFYIKVNSTDPYDNTIWVYNDKTGEISWIMFTEFIGEVEDNAIEITLDHFRKIVRI